MKNVRGRIKLGRSIAVTLPDSFAKLEPNSKDIFCFNNNNFVIYLPRSCSSEDIERVKQFLKQ